MRATDGSNPTIETAPPPWYRGPAFHLLVVLMSVYAVSAFVGTRGLGGYLINALLMTSLILGVRRVTRSSKVLKVTLVIVVLGVVGQWALEKLPARDGYIWGSCLSLVFFSAVLVFLVQALLHAERVDADTIFAAASVFMLFGIVCAYGFMLVQATDPAAFSLNESDLADPGGALLHYSFTTLTTVGYGSISPMSSMARMISDLEALVAQLYLAVVVAALVSVHIENSRQNRENRGE